MHIYSCKIIWYVHPFYLRVAVLHLLWYDMDDKFIGVAIDITNRFLKQELSKCCMRILEHSFSKGKGIEIRILR